MAHKPPKATLASSKGADLLAELKKKLEPQSVPENVRASPQPQNGSIEEELKAAFSRKAKQPPSRNVQIPRPKAKRDKNKEYIKIGDPNLRRAVIAEVKKIGASDTAPTLKPSNHNDFGEGAFNKLRQMRNHMDGFFAAHAASDGSSEADASAVERRIALGVQRVDTNIDPDDGFFLGYDFGTSTTKAVARYPHAGIDDAFAIDVPHGIAVQPHLWPTRLWFERESGRFSLVPTGEATCLDSFKTALIDGNGLRMCADSGATMAQIAIGYLALHFAYCLGSAIEQHSRFKLAGVNVGVPVAALKDTPAVSLFERVINAALFLVPFAASLTVDDVKSAFETGERSRIPSMLHTELAGAIAGYCAAPRAYVGGHMIIDCGSATLDIASFMLDATSPRPIAIYDARVEQLGADACAAYERNGATAQECQRASYYQEHLVYKRTREFAPAQFSQHEHRYPYQVILVGGGIHSRVHEPLFRTMEGAFHRGFHRPQLAPSLRYDLGCEPGRLTLADGLARDPIELRKVAMPGDPPPQRDWGPDMITKDQV